MRSANHLNETWSTAVHEAGHAVIGRVLGLVCGEVTTIGEDGVNEGHADIADPRFSWVRGDGSKRRMAEAFATALYAGAEAERFILGSHPSGDGVDRDRATASLGWVGVRGASFVGDDYFDRSEARLRARARSLVQTHAPAIEYLASILSHRGALDGKAVDELLLRFNLFRSLTSAFSIRYLPFTTATLEDLDGVDTHTAICHDRARAWVAERPGWTIVEGWLADAQHRFVRHSLVRSPSGALICVTAAVRPGVSGRFVQHQPSWSTQPFDQLPHEVAQPLPEGLTFPAPLSLDSD